MDCFFAMDNVVCVNNNYFFISLYNNWIYTLDSDLQIKKYIHVPFEYPHGCMEYGKIYVYQNKLFVLPNYAQKIAVVDIDENCISYIELDELYGGIKYFMAVQREEFLYLIPCESKDILIVNMLTEVCEKVVIRVAKEAEDKAIAWGNVIAEPDGFLLAKVYEKEFVRFHYDNKSVEYIKSSFDIEGGMSGICKTSGGKWYVPKSANCIFFESDEGMKCFNEFPKGYKAGDISFYKIIPDRDRVFLLPRDANMFLVITEEGKCINLKDINHTKNEGLDRYMFFSNLWRMGNDVYCIESASGKMYQITDDYCLVLKSFNVINERAEISFSEGIIVENPFHECTLSNFIASLTKEDL